MNPLRKKQCPGYKHVDPCDGVYCLFLHRFDDVALTPDKERAQNKSGKVRCPDEWEISAVKS